MRVLLWIKRYWWLVILGLIVGISWYKIAENNKYKAIEAKTYKAKIVDIEDFLELSGEIDANEKATLRFQTSGLLTWVGVKPGDSVKKYQVLASLDKRELQNSMSQLLNTYSKTRNDFEQAQADNKNWETAGMTDVAREAVKRSLQKEQADLNNSVLAVEARDLSLKFANLFTPIEGIVTKIESPVAGQNITPSTATFEVVNPKSIFFSATADQTEVAKFSPGQKGTITLDAFPDKKVEGTVTLVGFAPKTGSSGTVYEIKIAMNTEATSSMKLGMTGDVNFVFGKKEKVIAIPERYIKEKLGKKYVTVWKDKKQVETQVETGYTADGMVEIVSGLNENELVYN